MLRKHEQTPVICCSIDEYDSIVWDVSRVGENTGRDSYFFFHAFVMWCVLVDDVKPPNDPIAQRPGARDAGIATATLPSSARIRSSVPRIMAFLGRFQKSRCGVP